MGVQLREMLVIAISSRALFALDEANEIFKQHGLDAYRAHQRANEDIPLSPGTAMPLVKGLLRVNERAGKQLVEVIVVSQNDADTGLRVMNSAEHFGLPITRAAFTAGAQAWPYLAPLHSQLFLSADPKAVRDALANGWAAARVMDPPDSSSEDDDEAVRIAFDGDAVLFDDESERVFKAQGLEAFQAREASLADQPMNPGPFAPFLRALANVQSELGPENLIRTSLVTARNAPAHKRVVNTLRNWGVGIDETFFLGGVEKAGVLAVLRPHIFFDDQTTHLDLSRVATPSAHVPAIAEGDQQPDSDEAQTPAPSELLQ